MSLYRQYIRPWLQHWSVDDGTWSKTRMTIHARILLVCLITGLFAGVGAWLLKLCISQIGKLAMYPITNGQHTWIFIFIPLAGLLISGVLQRRVFKRYVNRGTERLRRALRVKNYKMPHQLIYQPLIGCAFTIGLGGSAGAEGPIAYAGAAIGSNAARFFRLDRSYVRLMVGMGAAAGIAAIFKAPLGGVFFALEVLGMSFTTAGILGITACCLMSATSAFVLSDMSPELSWTTSAFDYSQIWWLIPIGLLLGLYCKWYHFSGLALRSACLKIKKAWLRNIVGGLFIGLLVYYMPALYGEGYGALANVLNSDAAQLLNNSALQNVDTSLAIPAMLGLIILVKGGAVFTTNNAGGVSGSFAPTLFAGGLAGMLFAMGAHMLGCTLAPEQIAYVCMAGGMAGIVRAPLMATFITVEVSGTYSLLLPVCLVAFISYWIAAGSSAWKKHKPFVTHS
ncbi:MAG: chloride channel protein [Prevotella sp.]|nr:chloride channel protein [Prevotella sp.]